MAASTSHTSQTSSASYSSATEKTPPRPAASRVRSRGQLARRESFTGRSDEDDDDTDEDGHTLLRKGTNPNSARHLRGASTSSAGKGRPPPASESPILGGLTLFDIVFIGVAYAINLLRTLGIAEIADVAFKGCVYCVTSLPFDFYNRWTLSHPEPPSTSEEDDDDDEEDEPDMSDEVARKQIPTSVATRPHPVAPPPPQLSPFHHLVILLTRFACSNFPHLLPRVLFADQTMLPFVGWRTGGASWSLLREISGTDPQRKWRAVWMGSDAYTSSEVRRNDAASREASTILYLHGGGFSLGSVSFYAEALLRVLNKVAAFEAQQGHTASNTKARCVAVEYDLSPAVRFPSPLLQCLRCYAHLVEVEKINPNSITFAGDSAGGNLAMSMLLVLTGQGVHQPELASERDWSQLPLPGKALLISPWVDLRPQRAHAFAPLRRSAKKSQRKQQKAGGLSDSLVDYDWDYVASESLLHFAQVYAGILERPRRVMGPMGWLANLCGVLSRGLEAEREVASAGSSTKRRGNGRSRKSSASDQILDPARKLARAVQSTLEQPILEQLFGYPSSSETTANHKKSSSGKNKSKTGKKEPGRSVVAASARAVKETTGYIPTLAASLMPLFSHQERQTDKVKDTSELYAAFASGDEPTRAQRSLSCNPLLSPILGDWTKVQLQRGALVTWGERERLSADIESWVEMVQSGRQSLAKPDEGVDVPPRPDGEEEREREERLQRGKWLLSAVEHGPGGVHAWPFVAMYLAGTDAEREKGLETLARFVARPAAPSLDADRAKSEQQEPELDDDETFDPNWGQIGQDDTSPNDATADSAEFGSPTFFTSDAAQEAASGRSFSEEEFKAAFGVGVQYPQHERHSQHEHQHHPSEYQTRYHQTENRRPSSLYASVASTEAETVTRGRSVEPSPRLYGWHYEQREHANPAQYHFNHIDAESTRGCLHATPERQRQSQAQYSMQAEPQHAKVEQWDQTAASDTTLETADVTEPPHNKDEMEKDKDEEADESHRDREDTSVEQERGRLRPMQAPHAVQPLPFDSEDAQQDHPEDDNDDDDIAEEMDSDDDADDIDDPAQYGLTWASLPIPNRHPQYRPWGDGLSDISEEGSVFSSGSPPVSASPMIHFGQGGRSSLSPAPRTQAETSRSSPSLVLSPETRRFIRLEAQRQLEEEYGQQGDGDDDGEGELFSPLSDDLDGAADHDGDYEQFIRAAAGDSSPSHADASTRPAVVSPASPASAAGSRPASRGSTRSAGDAWWAA